MSQKGRVENIGIVPHKRGVVMRTNYASCVTVVFSHPAANIHSTYCPLCG